MKHLNNIKLISFVAFMQLRAKKTQTIVATIGVAFGITVFIFLLSCVKGVNNYISELSLEQCADIRLFNEAGTSSETVLDKVYSEDHNIVHHPKPENSIIMGKGLAERLNLKACFKQLLSAYRSSHILKNRDLTGTSAKRTPCSTQRYGNYTNALAGR